MKNGEEERRKRLILVGFRKRLSLMKDGACISMISVDNKDQFQTVSVSNCFFSFVFFFTGNQLRNLINYSTCNIYSRLNHLTAVCVVKMHADNMFILMTL